MKRRDQIEEKALDYCRQYKTSKYTAENAALLAFCDGAQWADENPTDEDPETTSDARKKYRIEVAELAKQLFIHECSMDIQWAFSLAERFVLSEYKYLTTGEK